MHRQRISRRQQRIETKDRAAWRAFSYAEGVVVDAGIAGMDIGELGRGIDAIFLEKVGAIKEIIPRAGYFEYLFVGRAGERDELVDLFVHVAAVLELIDCMRLCAKRNDSPFFLHLFARIDEGVLPRDPAGALVAMKPLARAGAIERVGG